MVNPFVCGSHSFPREEDNEYYDEHRQVQSAGSSPQRSSKCKNTRSSNNRKNPYSDRGLQQFSTLLLEIEQKREKIYSQFAPDEISFVQFDYSKDNNGKPIVVKTKARDDCENKPTTSNNRQHHSGPLLDRHHPQLETKPKEKSSTTTTDSEIAHTREVDQDESEKTPCDQLMKIQKFNLEKLRKPGCYMSATLILILVFLALFGRSVAIMCTSIGWYMMSTVSDSDPELNKRSPKKKVSQLGTTSTAQVGQLTANSKLSSGPASFKGLNNNHIRSGSPPRPAVKCALKKNR